MNYKKLDIPLFPGKLILIVGSDMEVMYKKFKGLEKHYRAPDQLYGLSVWSYLDSIHKGEKVSMHAFYLILNDENIFDVNSGVIAHEASHIKDYIFELIGETDNPGETSAYLIQWIVNETTKFLENVRKKKSNKVSRKRRSSKL